jgi:hypothetical protein
MFNKDSIPCFECDGTLRVEYQTFNRNVLEKSYVVENVPVHKCDVCGDEVLSSTACRYIEEHLPQRPQRSPRRVKTN